MTHEQLAAFAALGLVIEFSPQSLGEVEDYEAFKASVAEIERYLSPRVADDADVLTSIMIVLREAVQEAKAAQ
jgi:alkanesulfonate monooxygenase SsuD/methylene tetrahydromethanopterin reductase-like flavin-dependent oxidoreductase (luciferase family)